MQGGEYSTIPEYQIVKESLTNLYFICAKCVADYIEDQNYHTQKDARHSLTNLSLVLFPKVYVLNDPEAINYLAFFMRNPHKFKLLDVMATWLILQRTVERLGITKVERLQLPQHRAYEENANY